MNNFLADKDSLSLGGSEKENTSLLKNVIATTSGEDDRSAEEIFSSAIVEGKGPEKIQSVLDQLNKKMSEFNE